MTGRADDPTATTRSTYQWGIGRIHGDVIWYPDAGEAEIRRLADTARGEYVYRRVLGPPERLDPVATSAVSRAPSRLCHVWEHTRCDGCGCQCHAPRPAATTAGAC